MKEVTIHGKKFVLYIENDKLQEAIKKTATEIKDAYGDKNPLFVCIMNGAFMFASELYSYIDEPFEIEFARYSSYEGTSSTMCLKEVMPLKTDVKNRTVIIVEDLIDTGYTIKCLKDKYLSMGAKEVVIVAMLCKPEANSCGVVGDFISMNIENKFIVGHGLDYDQYGRMLKDIYQIEN